MLIIRKDNERRFISAWNLDSYTKEGYSIVKYIPLEQVPQVILRLKIQAKTVTDVLTYLDNVIIDLEDKIKVYKKQRKQVLSILQ